MNTKATKLIDKIPCEIKQVNSRKLVTNDVEYKIVLTTHDPTVLELGAVAGDILVDVTVETQGN